MDITAITYCNNEEENIEPLFKTLKGIDQWIVVDHLSTDKTARIARRLGAKIITQGNIVDEVTEEDVLEFEQRYGFKPTFKEGNMVPNWPLELNRLRNISRNDWILWIDADERLEWDRKEIQKLTKENDAIACAFIDKDPFTCVKFAKRSKTWWNCRIHSGLVGNDIKVAYTDKMKLIHKQRNRDYRAGYLPTLEYAYLKDQDSRSNFYLAREYFNYQEMDKAIQFFRIYLKSAFDKTEITKSYVILAMIYWRKGMEEEAFSCVFNALRTSPQDKEAILLISEMVRPKDSQVWKKLLQ